MAQPTDINYNTSLCEKHEKKIVRIKIIKIKR